MIRMLKRFLAEILFLLLIAGVIFGVAIGSGYWARTSTRDLFSVTTTQMIVSGVTAILLCLIRFFRQIKAYTNSRKPGSFLLLLVRPMLWAVLISASEVIALSFLRMAYLDALTLDKEVILADLQNLGEAFAPFDWSSGIGAVAVSANIFITLLIIIVTFVIQKKGLLTKMLTALINVLAYIFLQVATYPLFRDYFPVRNQYELATAVLTLFILAFFLNHHRRKLAKAKPAERIEKKQHDQPSQ